MLYKISEKVFQLEQSGKKVYKLNLGEPDWPTAPEAVDAAVKAIKEGRTTYTSAAGEKELREEIAKIHSADVKNVVVTTGSKWAIFSTLFTILEEGDEVVMFSPHWTAFELMTKELKAKPVVIDLKADEDWKIDFDELESKITSKTKVIIFNNPANPTSHAWSKEEEKKLKEIAKEKGIYLLLDCAYRDLAFERMEDPKLEEKVIITNSLSKPFGMTGWRIGYVVVDEKTADKLIKLNQITLTNVPRFVQDSGLAVLKKRWDIADERTEESKRRAGIALKVLEKNGIFCNKPNAGFYIFPRFNAESVKVSNILLDKYNIAMTPGNAFGNYPNHMRISLCYSGEVLEDVMNKFVEVVKECESQ